MASKKAKKTSKIENILNDKRVQTGFIVALILIAMFFSVLFRSYSATLPIADDWAQQSLTSNVRNQVTQSINQQYPNLPSDRKNELINEQTQSIIASQQDSFNEQVEQQATFIREQLQNEDGQTYLLAIDPYYYWRQTRNVVDHGYGADEIIDGKKVNTHQLAPIGAPKQKDEYHERISAGVYGIVKFFNGDAKLFNVFFWMPALISALAVIPAFFIARKKAGTLAGFITAMLVAIHTTFLGRTAAGFSDTDAYNVTFPLFIFWMFLEAFERDSIKEKLIFSGLTGLLLGIYSRTWGGWWYIFDFVVVVMVGYLVYTILQTYLQSKDKKKMFTEKRTKKTLITVGSIIVSSGIFVTLFRDFTSFISAPLSPIRITAIQDAAKADLWPNVFTTVAELNQASLASVVSQIGGKLYFFLALMGVIATMVPTKDLKKKDWALLGAGFLVSIFLITDEMLRANRIVYLLVLFAPLAAGLIMLLKDRRGIDTKYAIFLTIWFVGTIYASTQGVRFILLLVPAYAVALGILVGQLQRILANSTSKEFDISGLWVKGAVTVLALLLLIQPLQAAHQVGKNEVPSMNDAWWQSLSEIDQKAAPDAIINSWWDFGHWFKSIGNRPVTFDGASQNTPMAHWIGHTLSTNDEQEALGILRMLDCGSRKGFEQLSMEMQGAETLKEVNVETTLAAKLIMNEIVTIWDRDAAEEYLQEEAGLDVEASGRVLELTHCAPPENYLITSEDMVGKAGVWGHFGTWDFRRAYIYTTLREETPDQAIPKIQELYPELDNKAAGDLYYAAVTLANEQQANQWISPWPSYVTSRPASCSLQADNKTVVCGVNRGVGVQQGQQLIIEQAVVDLENPANSTFIVGIYQQGTSNKLGQTPVKPLNVHIGQDGELKSYTMNDSGFNLDVLVHEYDEDRYQAVVAAPELAASMFTRLFYLDGAYTENFEKFSDRTGYVTGGRVIVWNVTWPEN